MKVIGAFLNVVRANFLPASVLPFILGSALALSRGYEISGVKFFLALMGIVFAHLAANAANNYYDYLSGADGADTITTPFFGGTKVISSRQVSARECAVTAVVLGTGAVLSGLAIFLITKDPVFILMSVAAVFLGSQYTARPLRFSYRGVGEALVMFLFGPFIVMGSYYLFTGIFSADIFLISLVPAWLIFAVIVCNEIPDASTDKKAGKNNLVVILGKPGGVLLYACAVFLSGVFLGINLAKGSIPPAAAITSLFYLMGVKVLFILRKGSSGTKEMTEAGKLSVAAHSFSTLILAVSILLWG